MYWFKVKKILIVLFSIINIFLIGVIINNKISKDSENKSMTESLIDVLLKNDIKIERNSIPQFMPKLANLTIENTADSLYENAEKILGGTPEAEKDDTGNFLIYDTKTLRLFGSRLSYSDSSVVPLRTLSSKNVDTALSLLSSMGFYTKNLQPYISESNIVFSYHINNYPLFVNNIVVTMSEDKIASADGYSLKITTATTQVLPIRSANEILMDFLKDPTRPSTPVSITDISLGYSVLLEEGFFNFRSADAVPTYQVITSDRQIYYYDGRKAR